MGENSAIEWTDHTFNPWIGCEKVSAGCKNCYAERNTANRVSTHRGLPLWGTESTRQRTRVANWRKPRVWNRKAKTERMAAEAAGFYEHLRPRVFCASLADIFEDHKSLPAWRANLWQVIEETPELDWLLLTKRPQNVRRMVPPSWLTDWPKHVMTGASVENQAVLFDRVSELNLRIPGRHFLSCEPLLGDLNFGAFSELLRGIDWVIVGGESKSGARPVHPDWVRHIRNQCDAAKVPFFFKQWGEYQPVLQLAHTLGMLRELHGPRGTHARATLLDYNGRVLESDKDCELAAVHGAFPVSLHYRVGKKAAGRLLDGRTWDECPREAER